MPNAKLTRRDLIKLLPYSVLYGVLPPGFRKFYPVPIGIGRIATTTINVYAQPSYSSPRIGKRHRDQLITIIQEVISNTGPTHNPLWYKIYNGYVHSGYVQRIKSNPLNKLIETIPQFGQLCEVTVPYSRSWRYTRQAGWEPLYRLYQETLHWVTSIDEGPDQKVWYRIKDYLMNADYHIPGIHMRPVLEREYSPISLTVPDSEKRINISISSQTLTALEGSEVVLETKIASGLPDRENQPSTETPLGSFRIQNKMPSRHMGDGKLTSNLEAYELPGIPWTCIFHEDGVACHGTYWHNNFGRRMSHGCINMRNEDAKWLFRWTSPVFEPVDYFKKERGTLIVITE